jgi:predicted TIM-barrel fold metal-dependent hydrolase
MLTLEELDIVDCHHHLWNLSENYYPWLTDRVTTRVCGEYSAIRRDYLIEDFLNDIGELRLAGSVHVEAVMDRSDPVRETRWLQAIADSPKSQGIPQGIVAYCDLSASNALGVIEAHCASANVRGIRQPLHESMVDPANPRPPLYEDRLWNENFRLLQEHNLSFDLQVYHSQMKAAASLVGKFPETSFVLCHTGLPAECSAEYIGCWRAGMTALAALPNLVVKISGFGMFDRHWTMESIRPFVLDTIERFGPERCLFASNFPVDSMASNYNRLWKAFSDITIGFSDDERRAMFSGNAQRAYRLVLAKKGN